MGVEMGVEMGGLRGLRKNKINNKSDETFFEKEIVKFECQ
jgi:hypothetical protein